MIFCTAIVLFLVESNPKNAGYVCNHFEFEEDEELEPYHYWRTVGDSQDDILELLWRYSTLQAIIDWCRARRRGTQAKADGKKKPIFQPRKRVFLAALTSA